MLKAILSGCKLIALTAILAFSLCLYLATMLLIGINKKLKISATEASEAPSLPLLPPTKERRHNATEGIQNGILTTPAPKKLAKAKSKAEPQIEEKKLETNEIISRDDLRKMTKILLLRECKHRKLKGYSKLSKPQLIEILVA